MPPGQIPPPAPFASSSSVRQELSKSQVEKCMRQHGSCVPQYDIRGQQHYRLPVKDKAHLLDVQPIGEWEREPRHRTQKDLHTARRAGRYADLSYDVDGDGAVGPTDYLLGKRFGLEADHRMSSPERQRLVQELENGLLDGFFFGHEAKSGPGSEPVKQLRGKIIVGGDVDSLKSIYGHHWNADVVPKHATLTELQFARKAEKMNAANELKVIWDRTNPVQIPEPPVQQEHMVNEPPMTHIRQRRQCYAEEARESSGLDRGGSLVNPAREAPELAPTLGYVDRPRFATQMQLNDARKEELLNSLHVTHARGARDQVPMDVRHSQIDFAEHEFRRPAGDAMTATKLRQQRREDDVEYNMANFSLEHSKEFNQYSQLTEPWWTLQKGYTKNPPTCALKELNDPAARMNLSKVVETVPPLPVTQAGPALDMEPPPFHKMPFDASGQGAGVPTQHDEAGQRALKRWSVEFSAEKHIQAPVYFDGVRQAPTLSTDASPMWAFSSFESVRKNGAEADAKRKRETARQDDERVRAWRASCIGSIPEGVEAVSPNPPAAVGQSIASSVVRLPSVQASTEPPESAQGGRREQLTGVVSAASSRLGHVSASKGLAAPSQAQQQAGTPRPAQLSNFAAATTENDQPMTARLSRLRGGLAATAATTVSRTTTMGRTNTQQDLERLDEQRAAAAGSTRGSTQGGRLRAPDGPMAAQLFTASGQTQPHSSPALTVRSGGFQWLDQNTVIGKASNGLLPGMLAPNQKASMDSIGLSEATA
eukprot:TRINITY_DN28217_c0_g1_i1.p1 TRINITY_DN28217_c0_g1~~TRINITY_DN28217_c0_g1_i1.p1  ORF type:complete len:765 (-),score=154.74 TRINITY_DN28217_c0_g1_i1:333-2627(-)